MLSLALHFAFAHLSHGNISFDILESRAFRKYMVFMAYNII